MFTTQPISKGQVVEVAPCIDRKIEGLDEYVYQSPVEEPLSRLVFGYGSLYAHSANPNMSALHGASWVTYFALRDVAVGEELCINYGSSSSVQEVSIDDA